MAQKQADREKLAKEFPLLFRNTFGSPSLNKGKIEKIPSEEPNENVDINIIKIVAIDDLELPVKPQAITTTAPSSNNTLPTNNPQNKPKVPKRHRRKGSHAKCQFYIILVFLLS